MEMFVHASSDGVALPILDYGIKYFGGCYIFFRYTPKSPVIQYAFTQGESLVKQGKTFEFDNVDIPWVPIPQNDNQHIQYSYLNKQSGLLAELKVEGPLILNGYVDLSFKIANGKGDNVAVIKKTHIPAKGHIVDSLVVEGRLRYIPYRKAS